MKFLFALILSLLLAFITASAENYTVLSATPAISTQAYSAGYLVGGKISLTPAVNFSLPNWTGIIQSIELTDLGAEGQPVEVVFFDSDPSGTTFTDRAAFDIADADLLKVVGTVLVSSCASFSDNGLCQTKNVALPFQLASGATTLYAALVARASVTYDSASALTLRVGIIQG